MPKIPQHLNDEHMRLYEWSAAGSDTLIPAKSKRTHSWHASYGVLAVLTSLLILNGCNNKAATEESGDRVALEVQEPSDSLYEEKLADEPAGAEAGAPSAVAASGAEAAMDEAPEAAPEASEASTEAAPQ